MQITLVNLGWKGEKSGGNTDRGESIIKGDIFVCWLFEDRRLKRMFEWHLEGLTGKEEAKEAKLRE